MPGFKPTASDTLLLTRFQSVVSDIYVCVCVCVCV
jgi:hypothetical protein